jgi:hypothetical protein
MSPTSSTKGPFTDTYWSALAGPSGYVSHYRAGPRLSGSGHEFRTFCRVPRVAGEAVVGVPRASRKGIPYGTVCCGACTRRTAVRRRVRTRPHLPEPGCATTNSTCSPDYVAAGIAKYNQTPTPITVQNAS